MRTWRVTLVAGWDTGAEATLDRVETALTPVAALLRAANVLAAQAHKNGLRLDECDTLISSVRPFHPELQAVAA